MGAFLPTAETHLSGVDAKVKRATRVAVVGQLLGQVVSFAVLAALYRLIDPAEFGTYGMLMPIVLLARSFGTLGMDIAAIQEKQLSSAQSTQLFWYQIGVGGLLTLFLAATSPLLAWVYQAESVLWVGLAMSGTSLIFNSFGQFKALAERKLLLGRVAIVRLISLVVSGLAAVVAAYQGWQVWALVLQQYCELVVLLVGYVMVEPWRPTWPVRGENMQGLLRFSGYYTLSGIFFAIAQNIDKLILGILLGSDELGRQWIGYYTQAYNLMIRPVHLIANPIASAMLPAISQGDSPSSDRSETALMFYRIIGILLAPCGVGLFLVGEDALALLGGETWRDAGTLLTILALMIVGQAWINISGSLFSAVGKPATLALGAAGNFFVLATTLTLVANYSSADSADIALNQAWCLTWVTLVGSILYLGFVFRVTHVSISKALIQLLPALVSAVAMGGCVWLAGNLIGIDSAIGRLGLQITIGVVTYLLFAIREVLWLGRLMGLWSRQRFEH